MEGFVGRHPREDRTRVLTMAYRSSLYTGHCKTCSAPYAVGDRVWFLGRGKGCRCEACQEGRGGTGGNTAPAPRSGAPGAPTAPTRPGTGADLPADVGTGRHTVRVWETFADYVRTAKETKPIAKEGCWYSAKESFYGTRSWDDAIRLADTGYVDVRPDVDALVEKMEQKIAPMLMPAFEMFFDVSGGAVDIGRFVDGEPECMVETRLVKIAKPGRVITILVSGGVLQNASTTDIITRGCAIVALVDSLERMQHRAEIWLEMSCASDYSATVGRGTILTHLVRVKNAEDSLDIDTLMFAIAHPSRHRRLTFAIRRNEERMGAKFGVPREATVALTCKDRVGATLCLESLSFGGNTITGEKWVSEQLAEFGLVREGA